MTNAISVKDRLKRQAIDDGKPMQDKLVTYGLERTIYRLSVSKYAEKFTLKGGIFLYALFDGEYARATVDIDLLAQRISNDAEEMRKVFYDIFSIQYDDALQFDLNTLQVIDITEFKEYHGVDVSIMGYLDRTRVPVSIDIAPFDDGFTRDEIRLGRWRAFIKRKKALVKIEFEETMQLLKALLQPIVDSIYNDNSFERTWSKETKRWM